MECSNWKCLYCYFSGWNWLLDGTKNDYKLITVQDTTIVINSKDNVSADSAVTNSNYTPARTVSILMTEAVVAGNTYTVDITVNSVKQTVTHTATSTDTVNTVLADIKTDIEALTGDHGSITVRRVANELELTHSIDMDVHAEGGLTNLGLLAVGFSVDSPDDLPVQASHGRIFKIILTGANESDYWVKFVADDGVSGGRLLARNTGSYSVPWS